MGIRVPDKRRGGLFRAPVQARPKRRRQRARDKIPQVERLETAKYVRQRVGMGQRRRRRVFLRFPRRDKRGVLFLSDGLQRDEPSRARRKLARRIRRDRPANQARTDKYGFLRRSGVPPRAELERRSPLFGFELQPNRIPITIDARRGVRAANPIQQQASKRRSESGVESRSSQFPENRIERTA